MYDVIAGISSLKAAYLFINSGEYEFSDILRELSFFPTAQTLKTFYQLLSEKEFLNYIQIRTSTD